MKTSLIVSPTQRTTSIPFLPTLPIESSLTAYPLLTWSLVENEDDCIFQCQLRDTKRPWDYKTFPGTEYVYGLLSIDTPQKLVIFINAYASPIYGVVQDPVDGHHKYQARTDPFHWSTFIQFQTNLEDAMCLPIAKVEDVR
jgi:hypothetical protein